MEALNAINEFLRLIIISTRILVGSSVDVDRVVDRGHVAEGGGLVQGRGGRRLQRTQAREVVHLRGKVAEGLVSSDPYLV